MTKPTSSTISTGSLASGRAVSPLPSFDFQPLTRVVFGVGSLTRLGELTKELSGTRVLLVTDPGLEAAGHPQRALLFFRESRLDVFVFDDVGEHPTSRHVAAGRTILPHPA